MRCLFYYYFFGGGGGGQGFDTHSVQPFLFVCKVCFIVGISFSIATETSFMPVDIRHCRNWNKTS